MTPTLETSPALAALIRALDAAVHAAPRTPAAVAAALQGHLGDPTLLAPRHRRSAADGYRTNVVHTAPDGSFSLVALVWRPGQRTSVHSHRSWCVVGVHEGVEEERSFTRVRSEVGDALQVAEVRQYPAGSITWLATEEEIHDVTNVGDSVAVSLHVYGLDYRDHGSSILETFDLPILEPVRAG